MRTWFICRPFYYRLNFLSNYQVISIINYLCNISYFPMEIINLWQVPFKRKEDKTCLVWSVIWSLKKCFWLRFGKNLHVLGQSPEHFAIRNFSHLKRVYLGFRPVLTQRSFLSLISIFVTMRSWLVTIVSMHFILVSF